MKIIEKKRLFKLFCWLFFSFLLVLFLKFFKVNAQTAAPVDFLKVQLTNNLSPRQDYSLVVYAQQTGGPLIECFKPISGLKTTIGYCLNLKNNVSYSVYTLIYDAKTYKEVGKSNLVWATLPKTTTVYLTVSNENLYLPTPTVSAQPTVELTSAPSISPIEICSRASQGNLDCSIDSCINLSDYDIFASYFGKSAPFVNPPPGSPDLNNDGIVDTADFEIIRQNYNTCGRSVASPLQP